MAAEAAITVFAMEDAAFGAAGTAMAAGATGAESLAAISAAEGAAATAAGGAAAGGNLLNTLKPYGTAASGAVSVASGLKTMLSPNASKAAAPGLPAVAAPTPMPFFNDDAAMAARREFLMRRGSGLSRDNTILTGEKLGN